MRLSLRLETVASYVKAGSRIADIGTDHGYIPICLVERGCAIRALAMDVRKGPLERAKAHIRRHGLEDRIEARLSDGLRELKAGEADTVLIAGMGGELIIHILEEARHVWESVKHWILSPQSELSRVRGYLEENGFLIRDESMVKDDGKYYTVMSVERKEKAEEETLGDGQRAETESSGSGPGWEIYRRACLNYGRCLIQKRDPVLTEYLEREKETLSGLLKRLEETDTESARRRRGEVREKLLWIEEARYEMQRNH